jgi:hypothetical protein
MPKRIFSGGSSGRRGFPGGFASGGYYVVDFLGTVPDQASMLLLTGDKGDWCIRTDTNTVFIIVAEPPSLIGNWHELAYPVDPAKVLTSALDPTPDYLDGKADGTTLQADYAFKIRTTNKPVKGFHSPAGGLPVLPAVGDRYISSATASGWTIHHVYEWNGTAWVDFTPYEGMFLVNKTDGFMYGYVTLTGGLAWYQCPAVDGATLDISDFTLFVKNLGITDAKVAVANKDGTAATPSMRTLGNGALQAAAGNHTHTETRSKEKTFYNPSGITNTVNAIVFQTPSAMTVVKIRARRVGGTACTINARKNGASNHLASALSLVNADTWYSSTSINNASYSIDDWLEVMIVSVAGSPTQVQIQVDFQKAI